MLKLRFKNNKHNAVWLVEPKVSVGRSAGNDLVVDDPDVGDHHIEILVKHENLTLVNTSGSDKVSVNGQPVEKSAPLNIDDVVTVGDTALQVVDPKLEQRPNKPAPKPTEERKTGWALKANSAALGNRVYQLKAMTLVGRSNECDITLAAAHLSRRHVQLSVQDGLLFAKDLGSANGTYLNGERITEARVRRGDELRFDTLSFGVIGPADDMDKTTVRPLPTVNTAGMEPSAAATAAQPQARARAESLGESKSAKPKSTAAQPSQQRQASGAATMQEPAGAGKSKALWLLLVLVVIGGVAAVVAWQRGMLG